MKTYIILLFSVFMLIGCKTNNRPTYSNPLKIEKANSPLNIDSILYWTTNNYSLNIKSKKIADVLINYKIKDGKLYNISNNTIVDQVNISFHEDSITSQDVKIINGLPNGIYYNSRSNFKDWRTFFYDEKGDLNNTFSIGDYTTTFTNGNGFWKDYYFNNTDTIYVIKEEGQVSQNFKIGKWLYYSEKGKIIETKNYRLKDSIDVRFPHCLFNKKEPTI